MGRSVIVLDLRDNVATALRDLAAGEVVEASVASGAATVALRDAVEFGHKFALRAIAQGAPVVKYGTTIGVATRAIGPGESVHVHNVASARGRPAAAAAG